MAEPHVMATTAWTKPIIDTDNDGFPDETDNCPSVANPDQLNTDGDAQGNACDLDDDNDGLSDSLEEVIGSDPLSADSDNDGLTDFEEVNWDGNANNYNPLTDLNPMSADTDIDGFNDADDPQPLTFNLLGDIAPVDDPDGTVNGADYMMAMRIVLELAAPNSLQLTLGDVYPVNAPDGEINLQDLILMMKLAVTGGN